MLNKLRYLLWGLVLVAGAALAFLATRPEPTLPEPTETAMPLSSIGGSFTLVGSDGKSFSSAALAGKPFAIFFGFTHCPDVCPTTLARLAKLRRQLPKGDTAFAILFVTVDPARDTPAEMARYKTLFATPIVALTGTPTEIAAVTKSFGIHAERVAQPGGGYSIDHSSATLLFDRAGKFVATIAPDEGDAPALAKLKRIAG